MDLNEHRRQLHSAKQAALGFWENVRVDRLNKRPDARTWSVNECYDHLVRFGSLFRDAIDEALIRSPGNLTANTDNGHLSLHVRLFIWLMEPPYHIRFRAPHVISPRMQPAPDDVLRSFIELQDDLLRILGRFDNRPVDRIYMRHPVFPIFKLNLSEGLAVVEVHQRRHIWQAQRIYQRLVKEEDA